MDTVQYTRTHSDQIIEMFPGLTLAGHVRRLTRNMQPWVRGRAVCRVATVDGENSHQWTGRRELTDSQAGWLASKIDHSKDHSACPPTFVEAFDHLLEQRVHTVAIDTHLGQLQKRQREQIQSRPTVVAEQDTHTPFG